MKVNLIFPSVSVSLGILVHQQYMNDHHMNSIWHLSLKLLPYLVIVFIFACTRYQEPD